MYEMTGLFIWYPVMMEVAYDLFGQTPLLLVHVITGIDFVEVYISIAINENSIRCPTLTDRLAPSLVLISERADHIIPSLKPSKECDRERNVL